MKSERITGIIGTGLRFSLVGVLSLMTAGFLFIFIINWEDWFFGIKLDGFPAGSYLLIKAVLAIIIIGIILHYWDDIRYTAIPAFCYMGLIFFDSAWTIQKNSDGRMLFSPVLGIFLVIPLVLYCFWILADSRKEP